jgi:hypothetical protein
LTDGGGEQSGEVGRRRCAHARQQVLTGRHREARMGMTETFGHDLDRFAGSNEQ